MNNFFSRLASAVALCLPLLALAQAGRSDPADSKSPAPALRYQSAFADYKAWQDIKPGDWRAVNDNVRDGAAPALAPAAKASAPAMPAHGGHQMHGGKQ